MIVILVFWTIHIVISLYVYFTSNSRSNRLMRKYYFRDFKRWRSIHRRTEVIENHFAPIKYCLYIIFGIPFVIWSLCLEDWFKKRFPSKEKDFFEYEDDGKVSDFDLLVSTDIAFTPGVDEVIYIESEYDEAANSLILENLEEMNFKAHFRCVDFIYPPRAKRFFKDIEKIKYACPWVTDADIADLTPQDSSWIMRYVCTKAGNYYRDYVEKLVEYTQHFPDKIKPGFIVYKGYQLCDAKKNYYHAFKYYPLDANDWEAGFKYAVRNVGGHSGIFYKVQDAPDDYEEYLQSLPADDSFCTLSSRLMDEIRQKVEQLRSLGISEAIIKDLFMPKQELSRMLITKDYRIFLPDYNNMEIKLTALPKAVYFLFLRHPEGIMFKELSDYRHELAFIYNKLTNRSDNEAVRQSIDDITNPLKNSINEKCARIREAFVGKFSESIAQNYIVIGYRGEPKKITLDRSLVTWEKEMEK